MKIVAIIPARYGSTRLPGKPLIDINGKPMIWWVYSRVKKMNLFKRIYCAIDDDRIKDACIKFKIPFIMTKTSHPNHISRIKEVSDKIKFDYYICINGDEPLITKSCIAPVLPKTTKKYPYFCGARRVLTDEEQIADPANIKIVYSNRLNKCLYLSRSAIPFPKNKSAYKCYKYVGVECFNKKALNFFVNHQTGEYEKIEDIDHLRFLENGIELEFKLVKSESLSVDTKKDLEYVRRHLK